MKILCDADFIVYKSCAAAETEVDFGNDVILVTSNFRDAYNATKRELTKLQNKLGTFSDIILFFSDSVNFRKKILPEYKGHRNRKKPCGYKRVINALRKLYNWPGICLISLSGDTIQLPGYLVLYTPIESSASKLGFIITLYSSLRALMTRL